MLEGEAMFATGKNRLREVRARRGAERDNNHEKGMKGMGEKGNCQTLISINKTMS